MRTFVAIEVCDEVQSALRAAQRAMGRLPGVRWTDPSGVHLTLKFIGDIENALVPAVFDVMRSAVSAIEPFEFSVHGLGFFPPGRRPRVLWAGVDGAGEEMALLAHRLDEGLAGLGVAMDNHRFRPHLTLGRARGTIDSETVEAAFARLARGDFGGQHVSEIALFMSELHPTGAAYTRMGVVPLKEKGEEGD